MPGARWFPGAQVNYAQQVFRHADAAHAAGHPAIVFRDEAMQLAGRSQEIAWPELRRQVGALRRRARGDGRRRGRSRRRLHAQHPADGGRLSRLRQPGRDLVGVLARHGRARRARPLPPDRAEGARSPATATPTAGSRTIGLRRAARAARRAAERERRRRCWRCLDAGADAAAAGVAGAARPRLRRADRRHGVALAPRLAAVRPSALDRLLERHDRPAQADRPRPRRHRCSRRSSATALHNDCRRQRAHRRPLPLVQLDRLDHVEPADRRRCSAAPRSASTTAARRRAPAPPDWTTLWRFVGRRRSDLLRRRRGVLRQLPEGRRRAARRPATCRGCARSARPARRWRSRAIAGSRAPADGRRPRRSGSPRSPAAPTSPAPSRRHCRRCRWSTARCSAAASAPRSRPGRSRRERPRRSLIDEVGELVCTQPMPSMPLYFWGDDRPAARYLRQLLRHVPGRLAPRRLAARSRRAAARSSTAAATRPSTATASAWARPSCTARSRRCPKCSTAWSSISNTSAARATCRCSSCCARASRSTTR